MIILISPAKTFKKSDISYGQKPFFLDEANTLINQLKIMSKTDLRKKMKLSDKLTDEVYQYYQNFNQIHQAAIHSYYGHQYKQINIDQLEQKYHDNIKKHLYILSGLYGILNAYDDISFYRLEMMNKSLGNLYAFWKDKMTKYINTHHQHEVIYNLCSDEYGKLVKHLDQVITIHIYQHKNNTLSIHSMEAKRMRGLFVQHIIKNPDIDIKTLNIDGYKFSKVYTDDHQYYFIKEL